MALKLSTAAADAMLTTLGTSLNGGTLVIYSGTEPTTADAALSGNTALATVVIPNPAFGTAGASGSDRAISAASTPWQDTLADADGTATFFRALTSGSAVRYQGTVGAGQQLTLTSNNIVQGGVVSITSLSITMPLT